MELSLVNHVGQVLIKYPFLSYLNVFFFLFFSLRPESFYGWNFWSPMNLYLGYCRYSKEFQNYFFQEFCFFSEKKRWMPKLRGFYNSSPNSFSSLFAFEPFFVTFNWDSSLANESTLFFGLFFFGPFRFRRFPPPIAVNYFSFLLPQRIMTS